MMKLFLLMSLFLAILAGCASPSSTAPQSGKEAGVSPAAKETQQAGREAWQVKWDKAVQEAKKEGKVVIYGAATGQVRDALIKGFNNRYGIPLEYLSAKGPEIGAKLSAEKRAGLYIPDAIIGASSPSITTLKPEGFFDPIEPVLILPEVVDPKGWWENRFPWVDKEHYFVGFVASAYPYVSVNADMVKPEEIKSYRDLLEPRWKSKMVMHDPTAAGSGQAFVGAMGYYIMGMDFLKALAAQEPFISRDHRLNAEWVARGKYPIGIATEAEPVEQLIMAGTPLRYAYPAEGAPVRMGVAFLSRLKNAPHPNAGIVFINWLLSKEGQMVFTEASRTQSAREDIPTTNIDSFSMRKPGVKHFNTSTEEFWLRGNEFTKLGKDIFGHLIR